MIQASTPSSLLYKQVPDLILLTCYCVICSQPVPAMCSSIKRTKKTYFISIKGFILASLFVQGKG